MSEADVLIVGAGHGGAHVAIALRQCGFAGSILMVGEEPELPYERPPLSKDYLAGDKSFERILIRPPVFWTDRQVGIMTGRRVVAVDSVAKRVKCADGGVLGYGTLVWATGGHPRQLSCVGRDLTGVHGVRSRADVDRMKGELVSSERVAIVGGGYIGLEAAAVLAKLGKHVTVLEALPRVLARVAGEPLSRFYEGEHRAHGVDIRVSTVIDCIEERGGRAVAVRLAGGERVPADMVIVGIGIVPAVKPLIEAGAAGDNGLDVDAQCRTSLPDIYAIGDCAMQANKFADGRAIRLESVQNASDMATIVANAITGAPDFHRSIPWFWSQQYDLKLQTVGLSMDHDQAIIRGAIACRSFSVVYLKQGAIIALDCVNATRDYVQGKALIEQHLMVPADLLADTTLPLKDFVSHAATKPRRSGLQ